MQFPLPALICDVGGTNIRVARLDRPGAAPATVGHAGTRSAQGLAEAVAAMEQARPARSMIVCAAGPILGREVKLTNAAWTLDGPAVAAALGLEQGLLLHDFEALALSIPTFPADRLQAIGPELGQPLGPRLILGPGTGLGAAALTTVDGRYLAIASEAGHVEFGPVGADELALWPHLEPVGGRITSESVLSGDGLSRLHRARLRATGDTGEPIDQAAVVARALAGPEGPEGDSVRLFWRLIGRFAGDLALIYAATGGVTLAGGILPRIAPLIDDKAFRAAFEAKAPMEPLMRAMPSRLLTQPEAVLAGMAAIATDPDHYVIDYAARAWCR
ncbi:glucokinase [Phreatobacter stygius]|uniref:Glucokinase n=1 Tax=Phreatobacter stygius TaxID=1940610 RepID=A0A4D7B204_9HYPH|nr:glucokinase [Phreatobacter stygius]QCI66831.1 glucokinase [Phreatobacter stygius]